MATGGMANRKVLSSSSLWAMITCPPAYLPARDQGVVVQGLQPPYPGKCGMRLTPCRHVR